MQKHEEQLAEPLSQITNCVSGSKADLSVDVLNSESGGIRSFFPSVLDNWVRYYIDSMGDPCIKNSHNTLSSYLEHKALPFMSDFMMQAHIASVLIMLMCTNRDFFSQFDVKIDCPVLNPKWHFLSQLGVVSDHTTFLYERFYMNERIRMQLTFYRMIDSTYTFSYKGLHMLNSILLGILHAQQGQPTAAVWNQPWELVEVQIRPVEVLNIVKRFKDTLKLCLKSTLINVVRELNDLLEPFGLLFSIFQVKTIVNFVRLFNNTNTKCIKNNVSLFSKIWLPLVEKKDV